MLESFSSRSQLVIFLRLWLRNEFITQSVGICIYLSGGKKSWGRDLISRGLWLPELDIVIGVWEGWVLWKVFDILAEFRFKENNQNLSTKKKVLASFAIGWLLSKTACPKRGKGHKRKRWLLLEVLTILEGCPDGLGRGGHSVSGGRVTKY